MAHWGILRLPMYGDYHTRATENATILSGLGLVVFLLLFIDLNRYLDFTHQQWPLLVFFQVIKRPKP